MSQIENPELNLNETVKKAVYEAIENINEELSDEYQFKVYSVWAKVENYDLSIEIDLSYSIKFMEISEGVSEGFSEYIADLESELGRELTEEEIEKEWNRIYEDELEELNSEYVYPVGGVIEYNLSEIYPFYSGELRVEIKPLFCDGDYCDIGSGIRIVFENIRIETIEKAYNEFKEYLTDLLRLIHSIITL
jgi:hypothetical protein